MIGRPPWLQTQNRHHCFSRRRPHPSPTPLAGCGATERTIPLVLAHQPTRPFPTTRLANCSGLCPPLASRNGDPLQQIRIGFREPQSVPVAASSQIIVDCQSGLRFPSLPACTVSDRALFLALAHFLPSNWKAEPTNSSSALSLAFRS